MKITESTVKKLTITGAAMPDGCGTLDTIVVFAEDFGPGAGKITITCFGEAWSHYWSHMGKENTLAKFFSECGDDYLIGKLRTGIKDQIEDDDQEALERKLKEEIIKDRREGRWSNREARDLYNKATNYDRHSDGTDLLYEVLGDEWWYCTPRKPNPEYEYLRNIVKVVKEVLKQGVTA